jgi:hypothetical protein
MECYWSMTRRNATPFLICTVTPGVVRSNNIQPMQNVLKESNIDNSSAGSIDDDDFAAEFESELMDMS